MRPSISIVIPAYNEENRLPATLKKIAAYLREAEWGPAEILVVNDGSRDRTAVAAAHVAAAEPGIRVLENPGNRGKGYSVRHGMLEASGDWVLFSDADLSAPIEELEKLWQAARERKASVAFGSRALDRNLIGVRQPLLRDLAGRTFNLTMRLITGLPWHDTQCGFKLFQRAAAQAVFSRQLLEGFGFDVEVLFLARILGFPAVEVPVRWNNVEGSKVTALRGLAGFVDPLRVRWNQIRGKYH